MSADLLTLEQWKQYRKAGEDPSGELVGCTILDALCEGRLAIVTGRLTLHLARFNNSAADGTCVTAVWGEVTDPSQYARNTQKPEGLALGYFAPQSSVYVGESFNLRMLKPDGNRGLLAYMDNVERVHLDPYVDENCALPFLGPSQEGVVDRMRAMRYLNEVWPDQALASFDV
jgi:hypothetical protein